MAPKCTVAAAAGLCIGLAVGMWLGSAVGASLSGNSGRADNAVSAKAPGASDTSGTQQWQGALPSNPQAVQRAQTVSASAASADLAAGPVPPRQHVHGTPLNPKAPTDGRCVSEQQGGHSLLRRDWARALWLVGNASRTDMQEAGPGSRRSSRRRGVGRTPPPHAKEAANQLAKSLGRPAGGTAAEPVSRGAWFELERARYVPYPQAHAVVVTAADSSHGAAVVCLVRSLRRFHAAASVPIVVYDLGLGEKYLALVSDPSMQVEVRRFDYAGYPVWWNVKTEAGQYSFKPEIIADVIAESVVPVLWLDAGAVMLSAKGVYRLARRAKRDGMYTAASGFALHEWTHPGMVSYFSLAIPGGPLRQGGSAMDWAAVRARRMPEAGVVAVDPDSTVARRVVYTWRVCARVRQCIAPVGSDRGNHRQDQSALAISLAWKYPRYSGLSQTLTQYYQPRLDVASVDACPYPPPSVADSTAEAVAAAGASTALTGARHAAASAAATGAQPPWRL